MLPPCDVPALRQCVLAASVIDGVDVVPHGEGVLLRDAHGPLVPWSEIAPTAGPDPAAPAARRRVSAHLRLRWLVDDLGSSAVAHLRDAARLVALPPDHAAHGGPGWAYERLDGGALDLGLGVLGLLGDPDSVDVLPPGVLGACGADGRSWWPRVRHHAERMGALAALRVSREDYPGNTDARRRVLRPVAGCDVLALLASRALRQQLARGDGSGMRALAVPMRTRGWFELSRVDPAFVAAAWAATDEMAQGSRTPLLVTVDEVATPAAGGDPLGTCLDLERGRRGRRARGFRAPPARG